MSLIAFSALSFFFVIIVPLQGNDESNVSLIQTAYLVRLLLTGHNKQLLTRPRTKKMARPTGLIQIA
jgi:hypothetical protein